MPDKDFLLRVKAMRDAQKRYFRSRAYNDLIPAINLEGEIDRFISQKEEQWAEESQPLLAGGSND